MIALLPLLDVGLSFLQTFLSHTKSNVPSEVAGAVQAAIDAIAAHRNDLVTKAALDAQRG
jgi:hypothetical protein